MDINFPENNRLNQDFPLSFQHYLYQNFIQLRSTSTIKTCLVISGLCKLCKFKVNEIAQTF